MEQPQEKFKQCSTCGALWKRREDFLGDQDIELIGYQANFDIVSLGLLLFNHKCGTTLALYAKDLADLQPRSEHLESLRGTAACPGYCLNEKDLRPCPSHCSCAKVRAILQAVSEWPKAGQCCRPGTARCSCSLNGDAMRIAANKD